MKRLLVLFGAAVRADGTASETLARRIGYAAAAAEGDPGLTIFCSGGVGRHAPSEASVMARMLAGSVSANRLVLDEASGDTLQTVRAAAAFARAGGFAGVVSCTDSYHQPRVRMLFALQGLRCTPLPLPRRGSRTIWSQVDGRRGGIGGDVPRGTLSGPGVILIFLVICA